MNVAEIRQRILDVTVANGGHLASSLGAVEIAVALADVFDPLKDRVVWDVGHQAYAWKLLTGRAETFETLRRFGGVSGFPNPLESPADAAVAGHAGVALSVAEGLAAARDLKGSDEHVVAVIGDAAMANGTSLEALNNLAAATRKVIVILNDNEMSISRPTGSFAKLFGRLITSVRYNRVKAAAEQAGHRLRLTFLRGLYHRAESRIKSLFLGNAFFEQFGLRYVGPVDGHDLSALKSALTVAKEDKRSVIVHVVTRKGKGFEPAERDPTKWHGIGPQHPPTEGASSASWSEVFGDALCAAARADERIVALTAGMKDGTGLTGFARAFPTRFRDVGISEGHMVAYAAGLAAGGLRPVIAVYSTFLQRAVDQVMHDVCIAGLPVVFCVDRAGVVGSDGVTHQGVFDLAMLRCLPNLTICQPKDADDLRALLGEALARKGPTVIRYPRGVAPTHVPAVPAPEGASVAVWATGDWFPKAQAVASRLGGVAVHARSLKPVDTVLLKAQAATGMRIVTLENGSAIGGLGAAVREALAEVCPSAAAPVSFGWPDEFIPHGTVSELERHYGLDTESIVARLNGSGPERKA